MSATLLPAPPFASPVISPFARKLAAIAQQQHVTYHGVDENEPAMARQIRAYWMDLGYPFPGVGRAWSAVFISWCVLQAGATKQEFRFAASHSTFVHAAIQNALNRTGVFRAYPIGYRAPDVGDIIQNNRNNAKFTYEYAARNSQYTSHSAIVVERGSDAKGAYALTIGGNESDSIRHKEVRLDAQGRIRQRASNPYICVIQTLK